jgi:autotransporter family porin
MAGGFLGATKGGFVSTPSGGGGGGGSALSVSEEGSELTAGATSINFVGGTVTAAAVGTAVTVTDAGGSAASTSAAGIVEIATNAEVTAGSATDKAMVPSNLTSITRFGTVTAGTLSAGAALAGVTMSLGSDADGDTYYRTSNILTRLAKGAAGEVLTMNGGATAPSWAAAGGGGQTTGNTALTSALSISADLSAGNIFHLTAAHAFTLAFTNATLGYQWYFIITQDGTGGRVATWPATFHFAGGGNPLLSTSAAAKDVVHVICADATGGSEEFICSIGYGLG